MLLLLAEGHICRHLQAQRPLLRTFCTRSVHGSSPLLIKPKVTGKVQAHDPVKSDAELNLPRSSGIKKVPLWWPSGIFHVYQAHIYVNTTYGAGSNKT